MLKATLDILSSVYIASQSTRECSFCIRLSHSRHNITVWQRGNDDFHRDGLGGGSGRSYTASPYVGYIWGIAPTPWKILKSVHFGVFCQAENSYFTFMYSIWGIIHSGAYLIFHRFEQVPQVAVRTGGGRGFNPPPPHRGVATGGKATWINWQMQEQRRNNVAWDIWL